MNKLKRPSADFTAIPNELLRDKSLTMKAKGLYCIMFSKPDGWVFYNECLIRESNDGKDAVRAAMAELTENGWVVRSGGGQGPGGVFQPYQYELMLHRGGFSAAAEPLRLDRGGEPASSNTEENKTEDKHPPGTGRFLEFWDEYPLKIARGKCLAIWRRRNLHSSSDEVLAGVKRWAVSDRWKRGYIPNPSTFLNEERWKDTPPAGEPEKLKPGEVRVKDSTPQEDAEAKVIAEFMRVAKLPENNRKSDKELWAIVHGRAE